MNPAIIFCFLMWIFVISFICMWIKYAGANKELKFYKSQYDRVKEMYLKIFDKFYEPTINGDEYCMRFDYKLRDKYNKKEMQNAD